MIAPFTGRGHAAIGNIILLLTSVLVSLFFMEIAFRVISGKPIFDLSDWRAQRIMQTHMGGSSKYHPLLGWTLRDNLVSEAMNTIEEGIRKNRPEDNEIRTSGLLAVGDSFTAGSEVGDAESWPAQLERMIAEPVLNAGVGGYGTDQILLHAESLLPIVRPHTLIIGFLEQDILRAGFSIYGRPKPYFTIENGVLVHHQNPVPRDVRAEDGFAWLRTLLGHSLIVHDLMSAYFHGFWYSGEGHIYRRISNDEVDATCALLARVKSVADASGVRTLLMMQYGGGIVQTLATPPERATMVNECAAALGIQVVDEFDSLKAVWKRAPDSLRGYYVVQPDGKSLGHMSARGNAHIANLLVDALRQPRPAVSAKPAFEPPSGARGGDGVNRIFLSESLDLVSNGNGARIMRVQESAGRPHEFRLIADPGAGEHYCVIAPGVLPADQYTLSLNLRADTVRRIRVQLLDQAANGVLADVDLAAGTVTQTRTGRGRHIRAVLESEHNSWRRFWITAALPAPGAHILLQIQDVAGRGTFDASGEAVFLRTLQLETGTAPSAYAATSGPLARGFIRGDGRNLIADAEELDRVVGANPTVSLEPVAGSRPRPREFRFSAAGSKGEHYFSVAPSDLAPGAYTVSVEVRPENAGRLRIQLMDASVNGLIGDIDPASGRLSTTHLGKPVSADVDRRLLDDGWYRVSLSAALRKSGARIVLQILDEKSAGTYEPQGHALFIRALKLERGIVATPYSG